MLELATLGLLQKNSLHGYRLKQQLEQFMSSCISVNYGAIYPLLKRLEERGMISAVIEEDGFAGSTRKIYSITEQGKKLWKQEMMAHPQESWVNSRSRFMIKFFFFSHLEPAERIKLIEHRLMVCRLRQVNLEQEPPLTDMHQSSVWEHCMDVLNNEILWLQKQLTIEINHQSCLDIAVST